MASNKVLRYAGRMTCIRDFALGVPMERDKESLTKENCLRAMSEFVSGDWEKNSNEYRLWDQTGEDYQNIGFAEVKACERWFLPVVYNAYELQRQEIEATLALGKKLLEATCGNVHKLFEICEGLGVYAWHLVAWSDFERRIAPELRKAVLALMAEGDDWTVEDAVRLSKAEVARHKAEYERRKAEKNGPKCD